MLEFIHAEADGDDSLFYRFGVIDFLQAYTRKKKLETLLLRKRFNKKPKNCFSCVEPPIYADRFYEFLNENLFTDQRNFPCHEVDKNLNSSPGSPSAQSERNGPEIKENNKGCIIFWLPGWLYNKIHFTIMN